MHSHCEHCRHRSRQSRRSRRTVRGGESASSVQLQFLCVHCRRANRGNKQDIQGPYTKKLMEKNGVYHVSAFCARCKKGVHQFVKRQIAVKL